MSVELDRGKIDLVRSESINYLDALPFFDDITIVTEDIGDTESEINKALGVLTKKDGKAGVVIIWLVARAKPSNNELGTVFDPVIYAVRILENPKVNRGPTGTGKTAQRIGEELCAVFDGAFTPLSANQPMKIAEPGLIPANDPKYPGRDLFLSTSTALGVNLPQIAKPKITYQGTTVKMICDTPGAAIFYTTNGKKPNARNGTLYTGQFTLADPTTLKARAWLMGYLASDIATPVAGVVTPPEENVTIEQMNAALETANSPFRWSSTGIPMIKGTDNKWSPIIVTVGPEPDSDRNLITENPAYENVP